MDSYDFLGASLDTLVKTLKKSGRDQFVQSIKYLGDSDLVFEKGHFPYTYFDSLDRFEETSLPEKSKFYNDLTETEISDRDYEHAQTVWQHFGMRTFKDYHDFYMKSDVMLLSDCFESFRQTMISAHGLDCLHFPTLPSMTLQIALKITQIELDLITDTDQHLLLESSIRGGVSLPDFEPQLPITELCYLDANSLYATSQMYELPVGKFRFLSPEEIENFDLNSISDDSPTGYILEVDHLYPPSLHSAHSAYSLCPELVIVQQSMLSPILEQMYDYVGTKHTPSTKLITNLNAFMRPFIEYCNSHRQNAKTDFESGLYKLLPNAFFGKSCENLRKRVNIRFVTDPKKTDQSRRQKHLQKIYDRELGLGFGRNRPHQNLHESPHRPRILYFRDGKIGDVSILLRSATAQIRRQISYAFHGHSQFHLLSRNAGLACRYGWHDAVARYL